MKTLGTFYALELGFGISRMYKIYVTDSALCGAKVADKDHSALIANTSGAGAVLYGAGGLAMRAVANSGLRAMAEKEEKADALEPGSQAFLQLDKNNFSLDPSQLNQPCLNFKLGLFQKGNNRYGTFQFNSNDGKKRQLYLVGENRQDEITALMKTLLPNIEVVA